MIELLTSPEAWAALLTLTALEIVLGIDNVIFISVLVARIPEPQATRARQIGLLLALVFRIVLLSLLVWLIGLTEPVITVKNIALSWRDIILIGGGLFLIAKATIEIHERVTPHEQAPKERPAARGFSIAIVQILFLDLVFSLDSIIVGVGLTPNVAIIAIAIVVTVSVMLVLVDWVSNFVMQNPTIIMLALSFLVMVGMVLVADGFGVHVPKTFVYVAMAFSAGVETLNTLARRAAARRGSS